MNTPLPISPLLVFVCFGLAGCTALGPEHAPPVRDVPAAWSRIETSAQPVAATEMTGDLSAWWHALDDPLLSALIVEAGQASLDVRSAQARVREARARRTVAGAGYYPDVTATGRARRTRSSEETGSGGTHDLFSAGFDASWELDVFGGVRRGVEAAEADLASTEASLDAARVSLASEVALNYIEARSLQMRLGIARASLATQMETLQLTDWRAQAGLVSTQDVEQARSNLEQTRAQIPVLEASLASAGHTLDFLLGKVPGTLQERLEATGGLPAVPARIAVGIPAEALRQRPDVRAAERRLAAETARVGVAEAARYPSFGLSGSIGLEALKFSALGNGGAVASSLLAGITGPVFDGGRRRAQVAVQEAVREQAQVAYEEAVLTALQDVENALVELARNRERVDALVIAAGAARNAADLAQQRYSAGLIDFQLVLDTQRGVLSIEDSLASSRADGVRALIRLYKALGGGWSPETTTPPAGKDTP